MFEVIRDEYLSRTPRLRKGRPSCPFCTRGLNRTIDVRYIYTDALAVLLVHVGLAQARPNNYMYICQDGGAVGFVDFTKQARSQGGSRGSTEPPKISCSEVFADTPIAIYLNDS